MIFGDFIKALGQLGDPRFRRVLLIGIGLTVALLFGVYAAFLGLINWLAPDTVHIPMLGEVTWVDDLLSFASIMLMIVLSMFLMIPVASAFTSLFLEDVAQAVEDRHYPNLPPVQRVTFMQGPRLLLPGHLLRDDFADGDNAPRIRPAVADHEEGQ